MSKKLTDPDAELECYATLVGVVALIAICYLVSVFG